MEAISWLKEINDQAGKSVKGIAKFKSSLSSTELTAKSLSNSVKGLDLSLQKIEAYESLEIELKTKEPDESVYAKMAKNISAVTKVAGELNKVFDFTKTYDKLKDSTKDFVVKHNADLNKVTKDLYRMENVYGDSGESIAAVANSLSKDLGGSFQENLTVIEDGYKRGGNAGGLMLSQLKAFAPQIKSAGYTASEGIALIAQATKKGINPGEMLAGLTKVSSAISGFSDEQVRALKEIGVASSDFQGLSGLDAVKLVNQNLGGKTAEAKNELLQSIFGVKSSEAQALMAEGVSGLSVDLGKMPVKGGFMTSFKTYLAEVKTVISENFGSIGDVLKTTETVGNIMSSTFEAVDQFKDPLNKALTGMKDSFNGMNLGGVSKGFSSLKSSMKGMSFGGLGKAMSGVKSSMRGMNFGVLGKSISGILPMLKSMTFAQIGLNIAMDANPVGLIVLAIAALIAIITAVVMKYDEWGAALTVVMGPLGMIVNLVMSFVRHWDSIVEAFQNDGIIAGLKRIGLVLLDAILYPVQQLLGWLSKIPGLGIAGDFSEDIKKFREENDLVTDEETEAEIEGEKERKTEQQRNTSSKSTSSSTEYNQVTSSPQNQVATSATTGSEVAAGGGTGKNVNVSIENLINSFTISSTTIEESEGRLREMISRALLNGVRDFETTV